MAEVTEWKDFICRKFCENVGIAADELFGKDLSLAEIIARSERMNNSVVELFVQEREQGRAA